jgi:hypothetical protein
MGAAGPGPAARTTGTDDRVFGDCHCHCHCHCHCCFVRKFLTPFVELNKRLGGTQGYWIMLQTGTVLVPCDCRVCDGVSCR